jgi:hypothetical protein
VGVQEGERPEHRHQEDDRAEHEALRHEDREVVETRGPAIRQTASFDPKGLAGLLCWYSVYPLHGLVFRAMLVGIARSALDAAGTSRRGRR